MVCCRVDFTFYHYYIHYTRRANYTTFEFLQREHIGHIFLHIIIYNMFTDGEANHGRDKTLLKCVRFLTQEFTDTPGFKQ